MRVELRSRDGGDLGTLDLSQALVADVVGPVITDSRGKGDQRTDDELRSNLELHGLSTAEVRKLQGRTVAVIVVEKP